MATKRGAPNRRALPKNLGEIFSSKRGEVFRPQIFPGRGFPEKEKFHLSPKGFRPRIFSQYPRVSGPEFLTNYPKGSGVRNFFPKITQRESGVKNSFQIYPKGIGFRNFFPKFPEGVNSGPWISLLSFFELFKEGFLYFVEGNGVELLIFDFRSRRRRVLLHLLWYRLG